MSYPRDTKKIVIESNEGEFSLYPLRVGSPNFVSEVLYFPEPRLEDVNRLFEENLYFKVGEPFEGGIRVSRGCFDGDDDEVLLVYGRRGIDISVDILLKNLNCDEVKKAVLRLFGT